MKCTKQLAKMAVVLGVMTMTPMSLAADDSWTRKTDMPTARFGLSTSVVDGRIYAIGGGVLRGVMVGNVQAYDPATDSWVAKASMPADTCFHSTSAVDGKIYAIGGVDPARGVVVVFATDAVPNIDGFGEGPLAYREDEIAAIGLGDGGGGFLPAGEVAWLGNFNPSIGVFDGQVLADAMVAIELLRDDRGDARILSLVPRGTRRRRTGRPLG